MQIPNDVIKDEMVADKGMVAGAYHSLKQLTEEAKIDVWGVIQDLVKECEVFLSSNRHFHRLIGF